MRPTPFLFATALLLAAPASVHGDDAGVRLGRDVVPVFQRVDLTVDAKRADYSGRVAIDLEVRAATDRFRFHAEDLTLGALALRGPSGPVTVRHADVARGVVEVTAAAALAPGAYSLEIEFTNAFDTKGSSLYRLESEGLAYTFTQFEANEAREAFPCWDEPEFKIPWQFTLTVPAEDVAITNMPVERETARGAMKEILYTKTPPMPSYLLAVATGPFDTVEIPGMPVPSRVVTPRGQSGLAGHAIRMTPPLTRALEAWFGRAYPYAKLDLIAVPEYWYGAMENPGAITFLDNALLLPEDAGLGDQRRLAEFVAHEIAHMWFGDLVTMEWWDDLWLNEAFATWLGQKIADQAFPTFGLQLEAMNDTDRGKRRDASDATRAVRQPVVAIDNLEQLADELAYYKGHAVLMMFEQWLTPEVFQRGVRRYIERHAWKNATADDLWAALSEASGRDVGAAMATFLEQPGVPLVSVESIDGATVTLRQRRFTTGSTADTAGLWKIPMTLRYSDGTRVRTQSLLFDGPSATVRLAGVRRAEWVHPSADEIGYYRWSVPPAQLARLTGDARGALSVRERRGLRLNLAALLEGGALGGGAYLESLTPLAADADPAVVQGAIEGIERAVRAFWTPELNEPFAGWVRAALGPAVQRFGYDARPDDGDAVRLLRADLIEVMAVYGHDPVAIAQGEAIADAYMEDPALVDPSLVNMALSVAAIRGTPERFRAFRERFETTPLPTERAAMLRALASFGDAALADTVLAYALHGPLRAQEIGWIPFHMLRVPGREDRVFEWTTANYDAFAARIPDIQQANIALLMTGCTRARRDAIEAFFAEPARRPLGIETTLAQSVGRISECIVLREREGAAVAAYLAGRAAPR